MIKLLNTNIEFNYLYFITSLILATNTPLLMTTVIFYNVMYLMAENLQQGKQSSRTPIFKGALYFTVATIISFVFFNYFKGYFGANPVPIEFGILPTIMLAFIIAGYEESIFRNLLVKYLGSPIIATMVYTGAHWYTGKYVLKFTQNGLYSYLGFTFVFGLLMYYLNKFFKSYEVSKAVHFAFLLFNYGVG